MEHEVEHPTGDGGSGAAAVATGDGDDGVSSAAARHALAVAEAAGAQSGSVAALAHLADPAATPSDTTTTASISNISSSVLQHAPLPLPHTLSATGVSAPTALETLEPNAIDGKKTGRPVHPLWAFFHRGEKRNRYHYHAFCIYCVARYGAEHVAPTRGVSVDMLRHVEKCTNCPRRVVESVKDICGRHDAVRVDRSLKKKADAGDELLPSSAAASSSLATAAAAGTVASTATVRRQRLDTGAAAHGDAVRLQQHTAQINSHAAAALHQTSEALKAAGRSLNTSASSSAARASSRNGSAVTHRVSSSAHTARLVLGKHVLRSSAVATAAVATDCATATAEPHDSASDAAQSANKRARTAEWSRHALQTAVAAGLSLQTFQNADVQQLLQYVAPTDCKGDDVAAAAAQALAANVSDAAFVAETAATLAQSQLDRVKEGMHNSTIKGGLTLSVACWTTLDLQQLVAFTLVNANGDAACVRVVDMGTHPNAYSAAQLAVQIEAVLQQLEAQRICVVGIVADSVVALNAARCACLAAATPTRRALLVVPCLARQLGALAGSLFTHVRFCAAVGHMVEVAAFLAYAPLQRALELVSGDGAKARIPLPHRGHWHSLADCVAALLKYCDVITALCSTESTTHSRNSSHGNDANSDDRDGYDASAVLAGVVVPQRLKELVFADDGALWKTLQELHTLLLPLQETHALVFQGCSVSRNDDADGSASDALPAHGLTLAHVMYQLARMHQQYSGLVGTQHGALATLMQTQLDATWRRYDLPAMALAYAFDFHLDPSLLLQSPSAALDWRALGAYFHSYYTRWFDSTSSVDGNDGASSSNAKDNDSVELPTTTAAAVASVSSSDSTATTSAAFAESSVVPDANNSSSTDTDTDADNTAPHRTLIPLAADRAHALLSAVRTQQFPFDAATTSDYADVSSFYSFVSESHPEICALCCRLYALALLSADVSRVVRGLGFVPTAAQTTKSPASVELLLRIGFAARSGPSAPRCTVSSTMQAGNGNANDVNARTATGLHAVMGGRDAVEIFWDSDEWDEFASDWRRFLELELAMDEFDMITALACESGLRSSGGDRDEAAAAAARTSTVAELLNIKVPLDQVFGTTLPPLSASGAAIVAATTTATSTERVSTTGPTSGDVLL